MSILLRLLARATDTKGYPDDKNPAHWRTINHSKVHVDAEGNIDGGAGKKFDGAKWTSTRHPHDPSSYPPPAAPAPAPTPAVTTNDLKSAWKRVEKYRTAMRQVKGAATKKIHAQNMLDALQAYLDLRAKADASTQQTHKPDIAKAQNTANAVLNASAVAPAAPTQMSVNTFITQYRKLEKELQKYQQSPNSKSKAIINKLLQDVSAQNYDKYSLTEKKQIWKAAGSKANYLNTVTQAGSTTALSNLANLGLGTQNNPFPVFDATKQANMKPFSTPADADKVLRPVLENVWSNASTAEKNAAFTYSYSYKQFQEPLRGGSWGYGGGTGIPLRRMKWDNIGVGTMGKKRGEVKGLIKNLTSIISKSTYNQDIRLERGTGLDGLAIMFGVSISQLQNASDKKLMSLLQHKEGKDEGFTSCGSASGSGFSNYPAIMHIDCPAGTQMLHLEPFAAYGGHAPYNAQAMYGTGRTPWQYWDGKTTPTKFGPQDETLLQRGTSFRCQKVERINGKLHIYVQVVSQDPFPIP